eukprot:106665-Prymnesium_polylepis.1
MSVRSELESRCVSQAVGSATADSIGGAAPSSNGSRRSPKEGCISLDMGVVAVWAYSGLPLPSS